MNWIETQDELPPDHVRVLTCHGECTFNLLYYVDGRWSDYSGGHSFNPPQYWCELVAPQGEVHFTAAHRLLGGLHPDYSPPDREVKVKHAKP